MGGECFVIFGIGFEAPLITDWNDRDFEKLVMPCQIGLLSSYNDVTACETRADEI